MELHLNYNPTPSPVKISHKDKILLIGSCFAENIGARFSERKFDIGINPNGIMFNPQSIAKALTSYIRNKKILPADLISNKDLFCSLDHHSYFSSNEPETLKNSINENTEGYFTFLKECEFLVITFGSAFAYRHFKTNSIVANCHKLPQQEFKKELLSVETIVTDYKLLFEELKQFNPKLNIILTVSPVKYLRDGLIENNLSKSILIISAHELTKQNQNCSYFPSFELVNDDLRDYRFYKEDMAHPNDQAIEYVWEKFSDVYFTIETKELNKKIKEINQAVGHRPLNENSQQHKEFKAAAYKKCVELESNYPFLNFFHEKRLFE